MKIWEIDLTDGKLYRNKIDSKIWEAKDGDLYLYKENRFSEDNSMTNNLTIKQIISMDFEEYEEKFYLRHKYLINYDSKRFSFLNFNERHGFYYIDSVAETDVIHTRYSIEEIDALKVELNTDLNDYEIVAVEDVLSIAKLEKPLGWTREDSQVSEYEKNRNQKDESQITYDVVSTREGE